MTFTCVDNSPVSPSERYATRVLTVGKDYEGRKLSDVDFIEIFPCDDGGCWVFEASRFVEKK